MQTSKATLACIVKDEYPLSIVRATCEYGNDAVIKKVSTELCKYLDMVNLRSSMNAAQIAITAKLITERHPHLPIKAIEIFFEDAMCGKFGDHYGRIDCSIIMRWLARFEDDYFNAVEEQSYAEHQSTKGDKANYAKIIQDEAAAPMPESLERKMNLKRERTRADDIRARVVRENSHLYAEIPQDLTDEEKARAIEEIGNRITQLINEELKGDANNNN